MWTDAPSSDDYFHGAAYHVPPMNDEPEPEEPTLLEQVVGALRDAGIHGTVSDPRREVPGQRASVTTAAVLRVTLGAPEQRARALRVLDGVGLLAAEGKPGVLFVTDRIDLAGRVRLALVAAGLGEDEFSLSAPEPGVVKVALFAGSRWPDGRRLLMEKALAALAGLGGRRSAAEQAAILVSAKST
jgi:hypothetical protein